MLNGTCVHLSMLIFPHCQKEVVGTHQILCLVSKQLNYINPTVLRKAKTQYSFGLSECNRVNILWVWIIFMTRTPDQLKFGEGAS